MVQASSFQEEQNKVASKQKLTDSTKKHLTLNVFYKRASLFHKILDLNFGMQRVGGYVYLQEILLLFYVCCINNNNNEIFFLSVIQS